MVSSDAIQVGESFEMNDIANGGVGIVHQACTSTEQVDTPRAPYPKVTLRTEVTRPFSRSTRQDYDTIISVAETDNVDSSHGPPQSSAQSNSPEEMGIKIESLSRVFSSFLFASDEQKQELLHIAEEHDENQDGKLSRHEFEKMKDRLRRDHPHLYKIFVAVPERYTEVPVFILSTALLVVCVTAFHAIHYNKHHSAESYPKCSILIFSLGKVYQKAEVWRILSYAYAHADIHHCLLNVVMLLIVGVPLEMVHGAARVAAVWFVGSIGGVAGFALLDHRFDADSTGILTGASAAVSALVGGHFASLILNWKEDYVARVNTLPCCPRRSIKKLVWNLYSWIKIIVFLLFVGQDIVAASCKQASKKDLETRHKIHEFQWWSDETSFTSHFSGLIVGFLVGLVIVENRNEEGWERVAKIVSGVLIAAAVIGAIAGISLDAIHKGQDVTNASVDCSHKYGADQETIAWDVSTVIAVALLYLVFCLLVCTKGKRKMFRTLYARKIAAA